MARSIPPPILVIDCPVSFRHLGLIFAITGVASRAGCARAAIAGIVCRARACPRLSGWFSQTQRAPRQTGHSMAGIKTMMAWANKKRTSTPARRNFASGAEGNAIEWGVTSMRQYGYFTGRIETLYIFGDTESRLREDIQSLPFLRTASPSDNGSKRSPL